MIQIDTIEKEWYKQPATTLVYLTILLKSNWGDGEVLGVKLKKDEFLTSTTKICEFTGLSFKTVQKALITLEDLGEISKRKAGNMTIYKILDNHEKNNLKNNQSKKIKGDETRKNPKDSTGTLREF